MHSAKETDWTIVNIDQINQGSTKDIYRKITKQMKCDFYNQ